MGAKVRKCSSAEEAVCPAARRYAIMLEVVEV
jgi:hypothetical protein